jgi:hypothetical protein
MAVIILAVVLTTITDANYFGVSAGFGVSRLSEHWDLN